MADPITRGENESGVRCELLDNLSLVRWGCFLTSDWLTGEEVCRRINEIHLLSRAPALTEVRRATRGCRADQEGLLQ